MGEILPERTLQNQTATVALYGKEPFHELSSYFHVTHPRNPLHNLFLQFKQTPTMLTALLKDLSCSVTASAAIKASLLTVSILINIFTVTSWNTTMKHNASSHRERFGQRMIPQPDSWGNYKNGCRPLTAREALLWVYLRNAVSRLHRSVRGPFI